jgi:hypothetical protein
MMATGKKRITAALAAALLAAVASQPACAQLHSGSASIALIATLEWLSVSASPAGSVIPQAGSFISDGQPLAIKTSWAVPANRTTLRLTGALSDGSSGIAAGSGAPESPSTAVKSSATGVRASEAGSAAKNMQTLRPGEAGHTLMIHGTGDSNRADSRTSNINLILGRGKTSAATSRDSATFSVQVEAL